MRFTPQLLPGKNEFFEDSIREKCGMVQLYLGGRYMTIP